MVTNKMLIRQKRVFDLFAFRLLRRFAFSSNKDLFELYHKNTIKLLRVFFISFIVYSLLGGTPIYSAYLFTGSILLLISFTSPKQFKMDFKKGLLFWGQNLLFGGLGFLCIWLIDWHEGTNHSQMILSMFIHPIIEVQQASGFTPSVFWTLMSVTLLVIIFINYISWVILRSSMWVFTLTLKIYARFCFCLTKKRPLVAAYVIASITAIFI